MSPSIQVHVNIRQQLALELSEQILNDSVSSKVRVSDLLRKTIRLIDLLGESQERKWLEQELNGYALKHRGKTNREKMRKIAPYRVAKSELSIRHVNPPLQLSIGDDKKLQTICIVEPCSLLEENKSGLRLSIGTEGRVISTTETIAMVDQATVIRILDSVKNRILSFASKISITLRFGGMIESIFDETRKLVDHGLKQISPQTLKRLSKTYEELRKQSTGAYWSKVAYECREILKDFIGLIFSPKPLKPGEDKPAREQTIIKLRHILNFVKPTAKKTESKLIIAQIEYLDRYFEKFNKYVQKHVHPSGFESTKEDASRCLVYTYLIIGDILKLVQGHRHHRK